VPKFFLLSLQIVKLGGGRRGLTVSWKLELNVGLVWTLYHRPILKPVSKLHGYSCTSAYFVSLGLNSLHAV